MEKTKKRSIFSVLFGNDIENNDLDVEITDTDLLNALKEVDEEGKKVEEPVVNDGKPSNKDGGLSSSLKKGTLDKMRKYINSEREKEVEEEKER